MAVNCTRGASRHEIRLARIKATNQKRLAHFLERRKGSAQGLSTQPQDNKKAMSSALRKSSRERRPVDKSLPEIQPSTSRAKEKGAKTSNPLPPQCAEFAEPEEEWAEKAEKSDRAHGPAFLERPPVGGKALDEWYIKTRKQTLKPKDEWQSPSVMTVAYPIRYASDYKLRDPPKKGQKSVREETLKSKAVNEEQSAKKKPAVPEKCPRVPKRPRSSDGDLDEEADRSEPKRRAIKKERGSKSAQSDNEEEGDHLSRPHDLEENMRSLREIYVKFPPKCQSLREIYRQFPPKGQK